MGGRGEGGFILGILQDGEFIPEIWKNISWSLKHIKRI